MESEDFFESPEEMIGDVSEDFFESPEEIGDVSEEDIFEAKSVDEFEPYQGEEEKEEEEEEEDELEKEFAQYDPEFGGISFKQLEHVSFGVPGATLELGGTKFAKLEKIVRAQYVFKGDLYLNKFAAELSASTDIDNKTIEKYKNIIKKIPKYWLKHIPTLIQALIINVSKGNLQTQIKKKADDNNLREEDIYRYFKMVKNF